MKKPRRDMTIPFWNGIFRDSFKETSMPIWTHTKNQREESVKSAELDAFYEPRPPDLPGNWELVTVVITGLTAVFYWKSLLEIRIGQQEAPHES